MLPMTAKTLSWATFGLLLTGSVPFVSNPDIIERTSAYNGLPAPNPGPLPDCGNCNIQPPQEFQKPYALDPNSLCTPSQPFRLWMRLSSKIICDSGSYWVCEDTSTMHCSVKIARPACPQDTCAK